MAPGLEDEYDYKSKNEEQEQEDALPSSGILLVTVERRGQKEKEGGNQTFNRYQTRHT
jgi:hypothetical protein